MPKKRRLRRSQHKEAIELPRRGSTHTKTINLTRRLIKLFLSSIVKILAGRQMFASFPRVMLSTVPIASRRRRLRTSHSSITSSILTLKREEKASSLERKAVMPLVEPYLKCNHGIPTIPPLTKFQTT
jgi:hypothetical protein